MLDDNDLAQQLSTITLQLNQIQASMVTKIEFTTLESKVVALESGMVTKDDLKTQLSGMVTKDDLKTQLSGMVTKDDLKTQLSQLRAEMATKADLANLEAATKQNISDAVEDLATIIADTIAIPQARHEEALKKLEDLPARVKKLEVDAQQIRLSLNLT